MGAPVAVPGLQCADRHLPPPPHLPPAGTCYQEPGLAADDLAEAAQEGPRTQQAHAGGELAKFAYMDFAEKGGKQAAATPAGAKRKRGQEAKIPAPNGEAAVGAGGSGSRGKKPKLSTAVNLLDSKTAKTEALRQKQAPGAAVSEEMLQYPELLQRFMAGEGFAEPMPIQSRWVKGG
jgi:hypothetical protein